jgi:undecaprenyl-diphosphatase
MIEKLEHIDRELLLFINSSHFPFFDELMWYLSKDWPTITLVILFLIYIYRKFNGKTCLSALLGFVLVFACTDLSTNTTKNLVKRYRPTHNTEIGPQVHIVHEYKGGKYGFFSAHAANTFGVITYLFFLSKHLGWRRRYLYFLYPMVVCYSRMYLGVHYPSDILVGACNGILFGTLLYFITIKHFIKFEHARP